MKFPVDVLVAVSHSELEQQAQTYMGELLYSNLECPEQLTLPDSTKVDITISSVGLVPLYGSCDTQKVLALFAPADPFTPAALYLLGQWWAVGDILQTADSSREGLIQVDTLGERIVLYVLNRIVYRVQEMSSDELPFLCHGEQDFAKILWKNGQAVGFYSVKPTGSPCSSFSSRTYPLPVMDSLFVKKCHRGKGLGLRMLEDYVDSFKEDYLGLRYPLTTAMYKVCQCYLRAFPGDSELLWEVDSSRLSQRTSIASRIQSMSLTGVSRTLTYSESAVSVSVHHTEDNMEESTIVKDTKGTGPAGQKNTDELCSADIRISEEVTLLRLVQNNEVVQTEELLEVTTKNVTGIVLTELEEDTEIDQVTSLLRSQEDSKVTQNLNTLCSSVITVENVASEVEECLNSQEERTEENSHKTALPEGTVTMQRVLRTRTIVNIPQPSNVGDVDSDMDKPVDEFEITQGLKHGEDVTAENQTKKVMEETQVLHRTPIRGRHSSITTPKPTRASMRLKEVQRSADEADTQEHGPATEQHENAEIETGVKEYLAVEGTNEVENQEAINTEKLDKAASEELSIACVVPEIPPEEVDSDNAQSETKIVPEVLQAAPSQTHNLEGAPEEAPEEASDTAAVTNEPLCVTTTEHESLQSTQGKTEVVEVVEVIETRTLRSGARPNSTVATPRTTRSRKQNVEEEIVETATIKQGKKSTGRKEISRSKGQTQEFEASSAEEDMTDQMSIPADVSEDGANKDGQVKHSESPVVTETQGTVSKKDSKDQEPALIEDTLHKDDEEEVKGETDITEEETFVESSSAEAVEEEKKEDASSTAEVEPVLLNTTESDAEKTESTMEMDKESQPEAVMEFSVEESAVDKEPEPESVSEQSDETTPVVETRSLRSGPKSVTATSRHPAGNQTAKPEAPDRPQEKTQSEQDFTEEQSNECAAPEISSEIVDNDDAQSETKTTEVIDNNDAQCETKVTAEVVEPQEECPEDVSESVVATEDAPPVVTTEHENLSFTETKVVETRVLRSATRPISTVLTPRTTRSSKRKVEEEIVEKRTIKQGKKSTGRKRVSRSKAQTQELEASSAEDDTTEEVQTVTSEHTTIENNDMSVKADDEDTVSLEKTVKDSDSPVVTETQDTVSKENSKDPEPALVKEDTLHNDVEEEVKGETDITEKETVVVESFSAEAVEEKREEASSIAEVESVLLSTAEAEDTEETESTMEMEKESHPEAVMELNIEESGTDKEPEQESVPEQSRNQTAQPETPDTPQKEPQNEEQLTECVAPEIPSDVIDHDDAQSETKNTEIVYSDDAETETKIAAEVVHLLLSQTNDPEECPEDVSNAAVATAETPAVATEEHENLLVSETKEVVEKRSLRSAARTISTVPTPRTTRSSKRKVEEEIVEKRTTKRGKKSTGRKRVSRSKAQTQELEASSAEDDTTEEVQTETSGNLTIENNDMPLSTEVDEDGVGKDKPMEDLETTVPKEDSKDRALVEQDALHKDEEEEVKGETDITEEETVVVESSTTVQEEKRKEASPTADVEAVHLSNIEAEDTEETESTMEMDKESEPEAVMELNIKESGTDKELEPKSIPEQSDETTSIVETRSLRAGSTTVTATTKPQNEQDSKEKQLEECVAPAISSEINTEVVQLVSFQTNNLEETPEKNLVDVSDTAVATEEAPAVATTEHENLSISETEEVVETRALRSGARPISTVLTPRTTRSSKRKVEEETVEKTTIKQAKKSTGRKRVSQSKAQTQKVEASSEEHDTTEKAQTETSGHTTIENNDMSLKADDENRVSSEEPFKDSESLLITETQDAPKEDSKDQEPALVEEGALHKDDEEKAKDETDITEEETAIVENSSSEAVEEKKREEASSTAEVESVLISTAEAEDTEQTANTMEMEKEFQPEAVMELNVEVSEIDKEQESVPEQSDETTPIVETRSLRSGPKTVTATARNQTAQPETPDTPQEEIQNEQDSKEKQLKAPEISSEIVDNDDAQSETKTTEVIDNNDAQCETKVTAEVIEPQAECPEDVSESVVATEEALPVVTTEHENLSFTETKVVETRVLRSATRPVSTVLTPRTTRSSKRKVEEEIVEKRTIKQGKKSTGRKRVSRSKAQTQELEASSAEDDTTEEVQTVTSDHTTIENNDMSVKADDEDMVSLEKTVKDSESPVVTETQDTVSKEDSKDPEPALVQEDTLHNDDEEEVKGETDITVVESFSAEAVEEKRQEASSTAEVESVLLSTAEAEDTEETESTMEMEKESHPEAVMELNIEESGTDKEPEQESVPEQSDETTSIIETRSLRGGTKTVTATPRRRYRARKQPTQPETPDTPQEETQNEEDSKEKQLKECVAPEIPSEVVDHDDAQTETKINAEVVHLAPSQTNNPEETPEEYPEDVSEAAVATEEAPAVATEEHENLLVSETKEVVETRALRSAARTTSTVLTPRTTRSSKRKVEEEIVEKRTTKRGKKSTGRKRVSRSKAQTQELEASSAEDDITGEVQTDASGLTTITNNDMPLSTDVDEDVVGKDKPMEDLETTVPQEDSKDEEPALTKQDALQDEEEEEVKGETDITVEETAVVESSSAEAVEEKREEASSTAEVESVLISTTEAENTEQTESTMEMEKESHPEAVMELNIDESGTDKEPEQESVPEQSDETTSTVETRSLRSGPKTVTATPIRRHRARNQTAQPETPDSPQEELQNEQDSEEKQLEECAAPEIPPEVIDSDDAQTETKVTAEVVHLVPSQTNNPEECPEDVSDADVATEEALRSAARPISTVLTPRTTRSSKRKIEEEIVEKRNIKQGKKSTGRKRVSRSKAQTQELEASSAEDDTTEGIQTETSEHTSIENNDMSVKADDEDRVSLEKTVKDSESPVVTETQDTVSKEDSKDPEPALLQEDTLHNDDEEEVKGETDITEEETAVVENTNAVLEKEKIEEASCTADVESVLLNTTGAEDTEQTESTIEMDKESQPEAVMELNIQESGMDKEQESVPEQSDETTAIVETRSLRSGPKTVIATPRRILADGNQTVQPETPDRPQEEPQIEQDSKEEPAKECVAPKIPSEVVHDDDIQSETRTSDIENHADAQTETKIIPEIPLAYLPRVAVVLVDVQKVQVVKSINETAASEQQESIKDRVDSFIEGDQDVVESNQKQSEEVEMDPAECHQDHTDSHVPLISENTGSSSNRADDQLPEEAVLVSPASPCAEEDLETPVTPSPKGTRQSDIQQEKPDFEDVQESVEAHDTEVQKANPHSCQTPRRSSRKRARVDYRDNDDKFESLASEDISKDTLSSRKFISEPQSEEEESSEGIVLSLHLDEEEDQSASDEELLVITGKNLRSRSVPSMIISPHSKTTPKPSPEHTPRQKRRSARASLCYTSKRSRK